MIKLMYGRVAKDEAWKEMNLEGIFRDEAVAQVSYQVMKLCGMKLM